MRSKKSTPSCIAFPGPWCKLWREPPTPSMAAITSHCAAGICASATRGVGNRFRLGEDVGNSSQRLLEPDLPPFPRLLGAARVSVDASSRKGKLAADKRQFPSEGDKQDQPRKQRWEIKNFAYSPCSAVGACKVLSTAGVARTQPAHVSRRLQGSPAKRGENRNAIGSSRST